MPRKENNMAEKNRFLENLTPGRARRLSFAKSDIDNDGQEFDEEAGLSDPFDPVAPGVTASLPTESTRSMAAIKRDPDGDGLETAEEVGLSDPFDSKDVTDPQLVDLEAEEARGLELMAADLDGDGADLTEETGLTDPFNDNLGRTSRRKQRQLDKDLDDMGF